MQNAVTIPQLQRYGVDACCTLVVVIIGSKWWWLMPHVLFVEATACACVLSFLDLVQGFICSLLLSPRLGLYDHQDQSRGSKNGHDSPEGIQPPTSDGILQWQSSKASDGTSDTTSETVAGDRGSGHVVVRVRVNKGGGGTGEDEHHAKADEEDCDEWEWQCKVVLNGPTKEE